MVRSPKLMVLFLGCFILGAQTADPVLKARAERAQSQGIGEGDLPPVPRGIVEPPPLPPPETHLKDTRGGGKAAKTRRNSRTAKSAKAKKVPGKPVRKSSRKVKG